MSYAYSSKKKGIGTVKSIVSKVANSAKRLKNIRSVIPGLKKDYSPSAKSSSSDFSSHKSSVAGSAVTNLFSQKKLIISAVIILAAVIVVGGGITGYATYTQSLEEQLTGAQLELNDTVVELGTCQNGLITCGEEKENLNTKYNNALNNATYWSQRYDAQLLSYNELNDDYSTCQSERSTCVSERDTYSSSYTSWKSNFETLVKNTVKNFCCNGTQGNATFSISSNSVDCNGADYHFNCSSETTNYP